MVEPSGWTRRGGKRERPGWSPTFRLLAAIGIGLAGAGESGCAVVPKSRLDDCHRVSKALQTENVQLKDTSVTLRSENQDLNQRAVDDAQKLRVQDAEIERLVQSVSAYQQDRDQMAAALARIKSQIRTAAGPVSSSLSRRFEELARAHPGWEYDRERDVLAIPAAPLFEAGTDRLRPEARAWLQETAEACHDPEARAVDFLIVGRNETPPVRRVGLSPEADGSGPRPPRTLGRDRAARVRDVLADAIGIDPSRMEAVGFEVPQAGADGDEASAARNRRIEIHLRRHDGAGGPPGELRAPRVPTPPETAAGSATDRTGP